MAESSDHISSLIQSFKKDGPIIFLESQKKDHPSSNKSYLAAQPKAWIKSYENEVKVWDGKKIDREKKNPWVALIEFQEKYEDWLFGYLSYDLKNHIEALTSENSSLSSTPDMFFMVPGVILEISSEGNIEVIKGDLPESIEMNETGTNVSVVLVNQIQKSEYLRKIKEAQKYIEEGDFYEINLSHALEFNFKGNEFELYKMMRELGPVPFASFIQFDEITICCASPERFLSRNNNRVWSQPIKGTLSRNGLNDEEHRNQLYTSEKNRAENLMIVDLVRNDLSRIAKKGTVKVKDLFEVQSFETVHQMVSTVECEVETNQNSIEIIKACFPMGSMTGAPKISAMKAIEELEEYKRGIYSGAIGYIKPTQDFDFNVVIRTAIIEGNKLVYPVGGAITSDSIPEEEWEETLVKARALTNTLD